mmetsp:Transcript_59901/g.177593  ORF Transcript_59901/g.177593 Transcript_59901/m.177593 type:complete len:535 (-) Transcript_59901:130-1734(-)
MKTISKQHESSALLNDGSENSDDTIPHASPRRRVACLLFGIAFFALSGSRFNVPIVGWVASAPWLMYLRQSSTRRARPGFRDMVALILALEAGMALHMAKMCAGVFPLALAPIMGLPKASTQFALFLIFEHLRRALGDMWGLAVFPALVVASDWIGLTIFASSTSALFSSGYTQMDDLALLQIISLFGLGSVTFLVNASSAVIAVLLDDDARHPSFHYVRAAAVIWALVVATQAWGAWRLDRQVLPGPTITAATVGTDLEIMDMFQGEDLVSREELDRLEDILFERTETVIKMGAELVVWNELATLVSTRHAETKLLDRGEALAREKGADIVMGYGFVLDGLRKFENKYAWMGPEGPIEASFKHFAAPGENIISGTNPFRVLERPWGRAACAICYDYDFPSVGLAHARGGAGVAVVPASDWKGIDPYHTAMASVRGIEGGFSVVRSVRTGASAAYDPYGRTLASSSWFDDGRRIMTARVPVAPLPTLYSRIGDAFPCTCLGFLLLATGLVVVRRRGTAMMSAEGPEAPAKVKAT